MSTDKKNPFYTEPANLPKSHYIGPGGLIYRKPVKDEIKRKLEDPFYRIKQETEALKEKSFDRQIQRATQPPVEISSPALQNLRKETQVQTAKTTIKSSVIGREVSSLTLPTAVSTATKASSNAKVAANLSELIDVKKTLGTLGSYATFAVLGLDLLSTREKTPALFGSAGAIGAHYALREGPWHTRILGSIAAYATGRFLGSALTSYGRPKIEGLSSRGMAGQVGSSNFDFYIPEEFKGSGTPKPLSLTIRHKEDSFFKPWRDPKYQVKQPHLGSFTVGSVNRSMERQHNPTISGLFEGGMAASERHMSTEFGSGWLSKVWNSIRGAFGKGAAKKGMEFGQLSPVMREIIGGGAVGKDFSRLTTSQMTQNIEKYVAGQGVSIVKGKEELAGFLAKTGVSAQEQQTFLRQYGGQMAFYHQGQNFVYLGGLGSIEKYLYGGSGSRLDKFVTGNFRAAFRSGKKQKEFLEKVNIMNFAHEVLESRLTKMEAGRVGRGAASHESARIYKQEPGLASFLGTDIVDYLVGLRAPEAATSVNQLTKKIEENFVNKANRRLKRASEQSGQGGEVAGSISKLVGKGDRVKLSITRGMLADIKETAEAAGALSKKSIRRIAAAEKKMSKSLEQHSQRMANYSQYLEEPDIPHLQRYIQSQRTLRQGRRRFLSEPSALVSDVEGSFSLAEKKATGLLLGEMEAARAASSRGSISRQSKSANVPGLAQTGEAAKGHGRHGYHSGIDPMRRFIAKLGKSFSEVRESVHFQNSLKKARSVGKLGSGGLGSVDIMVTELERGVLGHSEEFIGPMPGLKFARKTYHSAATETNMLRQEAIGLKALEDSLTPSVYGVTDGRVLDMELIEGADTLYNHLKKGGRITKETVDVLEKGVKELHSKNLSHTDLTSLNIMVDNKGLPFIIDPMPGRHATDVNPGNLTREWKDISVAQDRMSLQTIKENIGRDFAGKEEELKVFRNKLQAISNAPSIANSPFDVMEKFFNMNKPAYEYHVDLFEKIKNFDSPSVKISAQDAFNVAEAMESTQPAVPGVIQQNRPRKPHFNQRNQEIMHAAAVQVGVGDTLSAGRMHRSMAQDSFLQRTLEASSILDDTALGGSIGSGSTLSR